MQKYTVKALPASLFFKVDPKYLKANTKASYVVRFEGYNSGDFYVPGNGISLTENGYTSNALNLTINNAETNGANTGRFSPIMTETGHQDRNYNQT